MAWAVWTYCDKCNAVGNHGGGRGYVCATEEAAVSDYGWDRRGALIVCPSCQEEEKQRDALGEE